MKKHIYKHSTNKIPHRLADFKFYFKRERKKSEKKMTGIFTRNAVQ